MQKIAPPWLKPAPCTAETRSRSLARHGVEYVRPSAGAFHSQDFPEGRGIRSDDSATVIAPPFVSPRPNSRAATVAQAKTNPHKKTDSSEPLGLAGRIPIKANVAAHTGTLNATRSNHGDDSSGFLSDRATRMMAMLIR